MLTRETVRELIGNYSAENFAKAIKAACAPATFVAVDHGVVTVGKDLPRVTILGVVKDLGGENGLPAPLLVADVPMGDKTLTERSSRIAQFKVARKVLEQVCLNPPVAVDGIIVQGVFAFHDAGGRFRVSLVTAKAEDGKLVWSQVKRQSFFVTPGPDRNATFIQRMTANWSSLAAIKEAFSVEKLTKEFYTHLFQWYQRACEDERVEYPNDLSTDTDNREDKNRKHLLRLITRLMFVWFLKQKGLVPAKLFDERELKGILKDFNPVGKSQHQYYRAILQNLFFATLNSEIDEREFAETPTPNRKGEKATTKHHGVKTKYRYADEFLISRKEVVELFRPIPFLNGGLFECLDQEGEDGTVMYYDGFSLQEHHRDKGTLTWAHVPNDLFFDPEYGIIPLLKRYNFTVEENTPGDEDVALDPELLGKVFENLLGAYNPETKDVVRKSTGSFYTPREIVNYMVDESLIAYLEGKVGAKPADAIVPIASKRKDASSSDAFETNASTVRAFVKDGIRPADSALCKTLIAAIESAKILDPACGSGAFPMGALLKMAELLRILKKLPEDANLYNLKLQLIENCIFGVDIQEIAVQISKLRFFISLVCEQKPDWNAPNYGINTLPNLETKFVAANSLIGLKRTDAKDGDTSLQQADLFFDSGDIQSLKDELWDVRHRHFLAKTRREKNALRKEDKDLRQKLAKRGKELGYSDDATRLMASWDPYNQNVHAEFFDPAWMFNVKDGFDVVIGNPPFIKVEGMSVEEREYYRRNYATFFKRYDTFGLFTELSVSRLSSAITTLIMPSAVLTNLSFAKLRDLLLDNNYLREARYLGGNVFEAATVDTTILIADKRGVDSVTLTRAAEWTNPTSATVPCNYFKKYHNVINLGDAGTQRILDRVFREGARVVSDDYVVYQGVVTGNNDAFIFEDKTVAGNAGVEKELLHSMCHGRDVSKWIVKSLSRQMLYVNAGTNIKNYPAAQTWLAAFREKLSARREVRNGVIPWFSLQWPRDQKELDVKEKILVQNTRNESLPVRIVAALDFTGVYGSQGINFIIQRKNGATLKALLAVLNSCLVNYLFKTKFLNLAIKTEYLKQLPLPENKMIEAKLEVLVDKILAAKKKNPDADTTEDERKIDDLVYDLYGLTKEEREIVEGGSDPRGARDIPANGGRGERPARPQSGSNEDALGGDCGHAGRATLPCGGRGATALQSGVPSDRPLPAKKGKAPVFEEEF